MNVKKLTENGYEVVASTELAANGLLGHAFMNSVMNV
jgi:hypothetical protein